MEIEQNIMVRYMSTILLIFVIENVYDWLKYTIICAFIFKYPIL